MTITTTANDNQRIITLHLRNQENVDLTNRSAHEKLEALLTSLTGRALFSGGTIVIVDNSTVNVSADLRASAEEATAKKALHSAFAK